jgi:hypothetical protein
MKPIPLVTDADRAQLIAFIKALDLSRPWRVTVKRPAQRRSLSQNALFWKWMEEAGQHCGYDKDDMAEVVKEICDCPKKRIVLDGVAYERRSTSDLTKQEMQDFMDRIYRRLVGDMGVYLTLPEEQQRVA